MWEKEKLLVTSNFFFSSSVLKRFSLQTQGLIGKGLNKFLSVPRRSALPKKKFYLETDKTLSVSAIKGRKLTFMDYDPHVINQNISRADRVTLNLDKTDSRVEMSSICPSDIKCT